MAKCIRCNGTGWYNEGKGLGCFYCEVKGGKDKAGNGEAKVAKEKTKGDVATRAERAEQFADVFKTWIDKKEAVKELSRRTGWITKDVKNFLNDVMYKEYNMFVFDGDMAIVKKYLPETPEVEIPAPAEQTEQ